MPFHPKGAGYADGGVGAADETDHHDERKIFRRVAAEEIEGGDGKHRRRQCIAGAANRLMNRIIRQDFVTVRFLMRMQIFTNAVENNDGFVHRIPQDRQNRSKETAVNFQSEKGENAQHHQNIVHNGGNGGNSNPMLKAKRHISDKECHTEHDI